MANASNKGRTGSELIELYQEIIDFFRTSAGEEVLLEDIKKRLFAYRKALDEKTNDRDTDLFIKGQIAEIKWFLNLPEKYRREASEIEGGK